MRTFIVVGIIALLLSPFAGRLRAQESTWKDLGQRAALDNLGHPDTATVSVRRIASGAYSLRTTYRHARHIAAGKSWNTRYDATLIDCHDMTLRIMRIDYYDGDNFIDAFNEPSPKIPASTVAKMGEDFRSLFAFACGAESMPPE